MNGGPAKCFVREHKILAYTTLYLCFHAPDTSLKRDAIETPALLSFSFLVMQVLLFVVLIPFP